MGRFWGCVGFLVVRALMGLGELVRCVFDDHAGWGLLVVLFFCSWGLPSRRFACKGFWE